MKQLQRIWSEPSWSTTTWSSAASCWRLCKPPRTQRWASCLLVQGGRCQSQQAQQTAAGSRRQHCPRLPACSSSSSSKCSSRRRSTGSRPTARRACRAAAAALRWAVRPAEAPGCRTSCPCPSESGWTCAPPYFGAPPQPSRPWWRRRGGGQTALRWILSECWMGAAGFGCCLVQLADRSAPACGHGCAASNGVPWRPPTFGFVAVPLTPLRRHRPACCSQGEDAAGTAADGQAPASAGGGAGHDPRHGAAGGHTESTTPACWAGQPCWLQI